MALAKKRRKMRYGQKQDIIFPLVNGIILCLLMFITLYPVLNTVAISFNDGTDAVRGGIGLWPRKFSLESYRSLLTDEQIYRAFTILSGQTYHK